MGLRILHTVEFYSPSTGGAQEVVRQVSERLAARGHEVTVATTRIPDRPAGPIGGVAIREFAVSGNAVRGLRGDVEAYRRFVADGQFDVVMSYAAQQWTTDALLDVVEELPGRQVLAPCGFSGLHDPAYAGYFAALPERLRGFDALILHSDTYQDARFVREAGVARLEVIPNAADEREFVTLPTVGGFRASRGIAERHPLLLTVGGHTGLKGHAQAIAVLRRSRRAQRGTLAIVGNTPTGRGCESLCRARGAALRAVRPRRRVRLEHPLRAEVVAAYADADLFLFCSAVECSPLVLFEAAAAGLPFVSVDVGNAREIAQWTGGGVVVDSRRRPDGLVKADTAAVTEAVDALLADPHRRRALADAGRQAWRERFTWGAIAERYEALYEDLAG